MQAKSQTKPNSKIYGSKNKLYSGCHQSCGEMQRKEEFSRMSAPKKSKKSCNEMPWTVTLKRKILKTINKQNKFQHTKLLQRRIRK